MQSTDLPVLTAGAGHQAQALSKGGFKVDMQSMDWQTLVTRRTKKDPADKGGWNVFHTSWVAADILNPISNDDVNARAEKAWFGWPTDSRDGEAARRLRQGDRSGQGEGDRRAGAGARARDRPVRLARPVVRRRAPAPNVSGWLKAPAPVMWNIEKK